MLHCSSLKELEHGEPAPEMGHFTVWPPRGVWEPYDAFGVFSYILSGRIA